MTCKWLVLIFTSDIKFVIISLSCSCQNIRNGLCD